MTLVLHPRLVLLDEPAAGITHQEVDALVRNLRRWRDELGTTLLLIEHNMRLVQAVSDHICVLDYGRKLAEGSAKTVLADHAVLEAYLGRDALNAGETLLDGISTSVDDTTHVSPPTTDRKEESAC